MGLLQKRGGRIMYKLAIPTNNLRSLVGLYPNLQLLYAAGEGEGKSISQTVPTRFGDKQLRTSTRLRIRKAVRGTNNSFSITQLANDTFITNNIPSAHISAIRIYEEIAGHPCIPLEMDYIKYTPHRTIYKKKIIGDNYPDEELYRITKKIKSEKSDRNSLLILSSINGDLKSKYMDDKQIMYSLRLPNMILLKSTSKGWTLDDSEVIL